MENTDSKVDSQYPAREESHLRSVLFSSSTDSQSEDPPSPYDSANQSFEASQDGDPSSSVLITKYQLNPDIRTSPSPQRSIYDNGFITEEESLPYSGAALQFLSLISNMSSPGNTNHNFKSPSIDPQALIIPNNSSEVVVISGNSPLANKSPDDLPQAFKSPLPERSSEGDETKQNQTTNLQFDSFQWGQFEVNMKRSYQKLRENKMFNDVTISCDNSEVEAHKAVLATSSHFFSRLLEQSSFRNNPHPIIIIKDVKMKHLMFLLDFMYTGEVKVPRNDTTALLQAAKELEVKGFQSDNTNYHKPIDTSILKRHAYQFSPSSALNFPIKRSRSDSLSAILSSSRGSSPIRLQPKIKQEESSFTENKQDYTEDGIVDPSQLCIAVLLEKSLSTSRSSDEKMSRESQRAALVEKVESRMYKCKMCEYTSKAAFNVKKHAEGHLSPRQYKCHLCPSVVKNHVYFKHHMKAKHDIKFC